MSRVALGCKAAVLLGQRMQASRTQLYLGHVMGIRRHTHLLQRGPVMQTLCAMGIPCRIAKRGFGIQKRPPSASGNPESKLAKRNEQDLQSRELGVRAASHICPAQRCATVAAQLAEISRHDKSSITKPRDGMQHAPAGIVPEPTGRDGAGR